MLAYSACGDTYNQTYVVGSNNGSSGSGTVEIKDCQDFANKFYECSPQYFEDYKNKWGDSIETQIKEIVDDCKKNDFFNTAPQLVNCIATSSCQELNPISYDDKPWLEKCGKYVPQGI